jgi:hypothetical protein
MSKFLLYLHLLGLCFSLGFRAQSYVCFSIFSFQSKRPSHYHLYLTTQTSCVDTKLDLYIMLHSALPITLSLASSYIFLNSLISYICGLCCGSGHISWKMLTACFILFMVSAVRHTLHLWEVGQQQVIRWGQQTRWPQARYQLTWHWTQCHHTLVAVVPRQPLVVLFVAALLPLTPAPCSILRVRKSDIMSHSTCHLINSSNRRLVLIKCGMSVILLESSPIFISFNSLS